jgi:type IV secretory pathway VirB6-like protein
MGRTGTIWPGFTLLMLGMVTLFFAMDAFAVADQITPNESFSCQNGTASGKLYSGGNCETTLGFDNVFSFLICHIESLSSDILGNMYCGFIEQMAPAIWATITLATVIFGIAFTFGVVPATGRDALLFLLKLAFVGGFATNADLLIGVAYRFLLVTMSDGVQYVLSSSGEPARTVYQQLDGFMAQMLKSATDLMGASVPEERCKNAVLAAIAVLGLVFPILAYLALLLLLKIIISFFRAVFAYIYAIVAVTFLLILAPIFVPFFLFHVTRQFFDKWIGYLASFVLQVVLLFAFLGFLMTIEVKTMLSGINNLVMYKQQTVEATAFRMPWEYCTLCQFKAVHRETGEEMSFDAADLATNGKLECRIYGPADPVEVDSQGRSPISVTYALSPKSAKNEINALMTLAINGLLALIILAIVVDQLLTAIPRIAQTMSRALGAGAYTPTLGANTAQGGINLPGESMVSDFKKGFESSLFDSSNGRPVLSDQARSDIGKQFDLNRERSIGKPDNDGKRVATSETMTSVTNASKAGREMAVSGREVKEKNVDGTDKRDSKGNVLAKREGGLTQNMLRTLRGGEGKAESEAYSIPSDSKPQKNPNLQGTRGNSDPGRGSGGNN